MTAIPRPVLNVLLVTLVGCSQSTGEPSPLEQWTVDVATSTSVDGDQRCRLDDWAGRLFLLDGDATVYAHGYSAERFCRLRIGMPEAEVLAALGEPLSVVWQFAPSDRSHPGSVAFEWGRVRHAWNADGVRVGMVPVEVRAVTGEPSEVTLHYSVRNEDTHYRQRSVHLTGGRVSKITAGIYVD
jgi:hypothetical protein